MRHHAERYSPGAGALPTDDSTVDAMTVDDLIDLCVAAHRYGIPVPATLSCTLSLGDDRRWHSPQAAEPCALSSHEETCELSIGELHRVDLCPLCVTFDVDAHHLVVVALTNTVELRRTSDRLQETDSIRDAISVLRRLASGAFSSGDAYNSTVLSDDDYPPSVRGHWLDAVTRAEHIVEAHHTRHADILQRGTLVAVSGVDYGRHHTSDEILAILLRRHHAPLLMHGRVVARVTDNEAHTIRQWSERHGYVYWSTHDTLWGRERELEEFWLDGIGGGDPRQAFQVLSALAS